MKILIVIRPGHRPDTRCTSNPMPILHFKGKPFLRNYHHAVQFHTLVPKKDLGTSKEPSLDDNLVIHGDNLKALKALLPTHAGKVKCIYIDPPYNTGNEKWVYNDNVASPMIQKWLGEVVAKDDLNRHDKWCCMMYPRLTLLKELMSKDGIIAITIDDNEFGNIAQLMDEIFGEENRLAYAPWLAEPSGGKEKTGLRTGHEYILIYHNGDTSNVSQEERSTGELNLSDKKGKYRKGRELRKWGGTSLREDRPGQWFALTTPDGSTVYPIRNDGREGHWRWGKNNPMMKLIINEPNEAHWEKRPFDDGIKHEGKTERWVPYDKIRDRKRSVGWSTWLDTYGFNSDATRELKEIFGKKIFDTPKPVSLISWLISICEDQDAIILDSFAGSGTTGHAVLDLNKQDGGNRKFILVECEDYADRITAERIRRVIKGVPDAKDEKLKNGLGGSFSYYELGDPIEMDHILEGKNLPTYEDLAKFVFFTATGEKFSASKIDRSIYHIGSSKTLEVYLLYEADKEKLKKLSLNLDFAEKINKKYPNRQKLVFAPCCFIEDHHLREYGIRFAQLPFEIYRIAQ